MTAKAGAKDGGSLTPKACRELYAPILRQRDRLITALIATILSFAGLRLAFG